MKNKTRGNKAKLSFTKKIKPALPNHAAPGMQPEPMRMAEMDPSRMLVNMVVVDFRGVRVHLSYSPPSAKEALAMIEAALRGADWPRHSAPTQVFFDNGELGLTCSDAVLKAFPNWDRRRDKARKRDDQIRPTA